MPQQGAQPQTQNTPVAAPAKPAVQTKAPAAVQPAAAPTEVKK